MLKKRKFKSRGDGSKKWLDCQYCHDDCLVDSSTVKVTCGRCTLLKAAGEVETK